jgi:thiol:disulfide interchange protein
MKERNKVKEVKDAAECALFGTGYDTNEAECQVCEKDFPSDYKRCKELTLKGKKANKNAEEAETEEVKKAEASGQVEEKKKMEKKVKVRKRTEKKASKKSSAESKTLQYVEHKVKQGKSLKGTSEQKILTLFCRGLGKKIVPLLKKGLPYGDWYRLVHWPERTIMERLGLIKYVDKKGVKTVMLG